MTSPATTPVLATRTQAPVSAQTYGALINLSGRQRMLSQRIVLYTVLASQGDPAAAQTASEALQTFLHSHEQLSRGGEGWPGAFSPALQRSFHGPQGADGPIRAFAELAAQVLHEVAAVAPGAVLAVAVRGRLQALVEQATPMLARLNALTQTFEAEAQLSARARHTHLQALIGRIDDVAREARVVSFNARLAATRAGESGREFAVVAQKLAQISEQIGDLAQQAARAGADSRA